MSERDWFNLKQYEQEIIDGEAIAIVWTAEDVRSVPSGGSLSEEACRHVLQRLLRKHDAEFGVNWAFIEEIASDVKASFDQQGD